MSEAQTRGQDGKFVSPPPPADLDQADAKALDIKDDDGAGALSKGDLEKQRLENDPRIAMMKRSRTKRAEEMGAEVEGDASTEKVDTGAPVVAPTEGVEAPKPEEVAAPKKEEDEAPAHVATLADTDLVEITVNGEVKKMPWGEAKKAVQLSAATEETLADAKAERAAARAARRIADEDAAAKPPVKADAQPTGPTPEEKIATAKSAKKSAHDKYTQAVRYGTDEEIKAATDDLEKAEDALDDAKLAAFKVPTQAPGPDPLLIRESADTDRAKETFLESFADDMKDKLFKAAHGMNMREELINDLVKIASLTDREEVGKILVNLSDQELGAHHLQARSRGLVRTLDKVLTAAGTKARDELKSRSAPTSAATDPRSQREQAKIATPTPPRSATGSVPEPEEQKPMTSREIADEHKRRRGKA